MEQKKTLWILAAVGLFLLVVFGCGFLVFRSTNNQPLYASKTVDKPKQTSGWTNNQDIPTQSNQDFQRPDFNNPGSAKTNEMIVVSENTTIYDLNKNTGISSENNSQSTTIDLNALKKELTEEVTAATTSKPQNINITVTMPETNTTPVVIDSDYYTGKAKEVESEKKETSTTTVNKTTATTTTTTKPAKTTPTVTTATTVKPAASTPKQVTRFWVQVAAYSNKKTAENARSVLTENKITSDIFTYQDNKNRLFYRVRVGPYTTKSEAEYWQAKILKIADFKESQSYVTSTTD